MPYEEWIKINPEVEKIACTKCEDGEIDCEDCNGTGECDNCDCEMEHPCGYCDGDGYFECKDCRGAGTSARAIYGRIKNEEMEKVKKNENI